MVGGVEGQAVSAGVFDRWEQVVAFALTLPDSYMDPYYGTPAPR